MAIINDAGGYISYECSDLINECYSDYMEFGFSTKAKAVCRVAEDVKIIVDYIIGEVEDDYKLADDEFIEESTLKDILSYLIRQNSTFNQYGNILMLRLASKMTQKEFADYFNFPKRTVENWERGQRRCPEYLIALVEYKLKNENLI